LYCADVCKVSAVVSICSFAHLFGDVPLLGDRKYFQAYPFKRNDA